MNRNMSRPKLKKKSVLIAIGSLITLICLISAIIYFVTYSPVHQDITIEAGSTLQENLFLKDKDESIEIKTGLTEEQLITIGEYNVVVVYKDKEYTCNVNVQDTVAPTATPQDVEAYINSEIKADSFVKDIVDVTKVTVSFKAEPAMETSGKQDVIIILTDEGKNITELTASLNILEDKEAPVINGVKDIVVTQGGTISYKKDVTVTDNADSEVELKIDSSKVNLDKIGTYKVIYSATDKAGNTATKEITVSVVAKGSSSTEEVYAKADAVLAKIIKDGMTQKEKCKQIFNWVHSNVSFIDHSDKSSWVDGAMYAFQNHKGDCFNYFAVTKALLTRAGIENIDLTATQKVHYWNFVKVEEGWYHLDTTPRVDHPDLFLKTDAWIENYSKKHSGCFSYVSATKPASATQ